MKIETDEEKDARELRELEGKNIQYYTVLVTTWTTTKMEHDKTLITISAAAIGLLITILTTKSIVELWLIFVYGLAFICYCVTIVSALIIFQKNSLYIENELRGQGGNDPHLARLDKISLWSFMIATIAFISIGVISAIHKFQEVEKVPDQIIKVQVVDSDLGKSLQGLSDLKPATNQPQNAPQSTPNNNPSNENLSVVRFGPCIAL